jgi:hypothetical protein
MKLLEVVAQKIIIKICDMVDQLFYVSKRCLRSCRASLLFATVGSVSTMGEVVRVRWRNQHHVWQSSDHAMTLFAVLYCYK